MKSDQERQLRREQTLRRTAGYAKRLGAFQGDVCFFCEGPMLYAQDLPQEERNGEWVAARTRVIPKYMGGTGHLDNTVMAHRKCNTDDNFRNTDAIEAMFNKLEDLNKLRGFEPSLRQKHHFFGDNVVAEHLGYVLAEIDDPIAAKRMNRWVSNRVHHTYKLIRQTRSLEPDFMVEVCDEMLKKAFANIQRDWDRDEAKGHKSGRPTDMVVNLTKQACRILCRDAGRELKLYPHLSMNPAPDSLPCESV